MVAEALGTGIIVAGGCGMVSAMSGVSVGRHSFYAHSFFPLQKFSNYIYENMQCRVNIRHGFPLFFLFVLSLLFYFYLFHLFLFYFILFYFI